MKGVTDFMNHLVVEKIASYIEQHLEEDLSLDKIAKELNYSKFYIARVFAGNTDCTIYKYIQGRRLTKAAFELVNTTKPIIEIAYEAKYSSPQAFSLAFHQAYQCTPQNYRKNGVFYPIKRKLYKENDIKSILFMSFSVEGKIAA